MKVAETLMFLLAFLLLPAACAEDSIPLGPARPGVVHTHPNPARCNDYISKAQSVIGKLRSLAPTHRWIVVCSLDAWNLALHKSRAWGRTNTAFTNEANDMTLINGAVFEEAEQFYKQVILHEAGHVKCACSDEQKADAAAQELVIADSNSVKPPARSQ